MKKNEVYNGWKVLSVTEISEYKSECLWLRHEKTGMEVFHMKNTDEENLFAFSFKTLPRDSRGTAHVLEHSVLCGSEHYPLKDPFIVLVNQSVKTFMNALTFPDKTVYPASSTVEKDYFNVMSVYGDAVFFPLLQKEVFLQEGHHFEYDENGNLTVQGVVYNEMKGNYSSFDNIAGDLTLTTLLPGTAYEHDSGGDPEFIPDLTYEDFLEFHRKYYSPSNCKLFLYGNIPTEKQVDFLNTCFLDGHDFPAFVSEQESPLVAFGSPRTVEASAPAADKGSGDMEPTVAISWMTGDTSSAENFMQMVLLDELLMGHDGSPLSKALLDSPFGDDISPVSGMTSEMKYLVYTVGKRNVKAEDAKAFEQLVLSVLEDKAENGFSEADVDAAIMAVDFSSREIKRSNGPYSLRLMRYCLRGWMNGASPDSTLRNTEAFAKIKKDIEKDPEYIQKLLKGLLLDNNHRVTLTVKPDTSYQSDREKKLCDYCLSKAKVLKKAEVEEELELLRKFQTEKDTPEKLSLLPHLRVSELPAKNDRIAMKKELYEGIPYYSHAEVVNGINYVTLGFPVDTLPPDCYRFLPFYTIAATNMGFSGMNWAEAASAFASVSGGFGASLFSSSVVDSVICENAGDGCPPQDVAARLYEKDPCLARQWMFFRIKMLEEKTAEALDVFFDCLENVSFDDYKRLESLAAEYKNDISSSIVPGGHEYASSRSSCRRTFSKMCDEIWNGISQLYTAREIVAMEVEQLSGKLYAIKEKLLKSGVVIDMTSTEEGVTNMVPLLKAHLSSFSGPVQPASFSREDFLPYTILPGQESSLEDEYFNAASEVGFAACSLDASSSDDDESAAEIVLSHWLSNNIMWEKLRTIGGAYGAFASVDNTERSFILSTYRDPDPEKSLSVFYDCLKTASELELDEDTVEKAITGVYSRIFQPGAPAGNGFKGFVRCLYGITDEYREGRVKKILSVTAEEIRRAASRLVTKYENSKKTAILGKKIKYTGKIIDLPLY
ncbi:MAG: insulinase family protein [Treponemataceae bacterium]|nr:insulinase family protein [Treponemataceae bacterium]